MLLLRKGVGGHRGGDYPNQNGNGFVFYEHNFTGRAFRSRERSAALEGACPLRGEGEEKKKERKKRKANNELSDPPLPPLSCPRALLQAERTRQRDSPTQRAASQPHLLTTAPHKAHTQEDCLPLATHSRCFLFVKEDNSIKLYSIFTSGYSLLAERGHGKGEGALHFNVLSCHARTCLCVCVRASQGQGLKVP